MTRTTTVNPTRGNPVRLDLELVEERAFGSGLIYARYRTAEPDGR